MGPLALFEGCYGKTENEKHEWLKALKKKIEDAAEKPPSPKKKKSNKMPPIDDEQLTRMDIKAIR